MEKSNKSSGGQIVALVAALAMLLCFFLPWLEMNFLLGHATVTGFDLATGRVTGRGQEFISLWLAPVGALVVIILSIAGLNRKTAQSGTGGIIVVAALVGGAAILYFYFSLQGDLNRTSNNPFEQLGQAIARQMITVLFGLYGALASSLAMLVGGLIEIAAGKNTSKQSVSSGAGSFGVNEFANAAPFAPAPSPVAAPAFTPSASARTETPQPAPAFNAAPPSAPVLTPAGARCPRCGNQNNPGNRFCTSCGADVFNAPAPPMPPPPVFNASAPAAPQIDPLVGQTLDGKYRIEAKLGAGGMGTVYRATRLMIGDVVAIKVLHAEQVADPNAPERFRREAQAAARLKHPNAVTVHDFGVSREGLVYLVMELVEGWSLRQVIVQQGQLAPAAASEIMNQACAALDEAHRQNIVHRDIKPDNIIINTTGGGLRVKVLDFGIAKLRDLSATASNLTQTGSVMGTPHYMSPEQCLGEELDSRSDIYSLGIVLYEMLAGVVPFNSPTATAVAVQHVSQAPPQLRSINPNVPPSVEAAAMRALEKRRETRPQTAGALARMLATAISSGGGGAAPGPIAAPSANPVNSSGLTPTMVMPSVGRESGRSAPVISEPFANDSASPLFEQTAASAKTDSSKRQRQIIIAGAAAAVIALTAIIYFAFFTPKRSILAQVRKGNLVKPEGGSAYDLYLKNKNSFSANDRVEIENEVVPALDNRGNQILNKLKQETEESEVEWAEAARLYTWLQELRPQPAYQSRQYFSQGRLAFLKKEYHVAIPNYQRAIELDSSWALPFNGLGRAYVNMKDKTSGRDAYFRATSIEPGWIYPWLNLGGVSLELNDPYTAENAARQAIAIEPAKASAHYLLGRALEKQGRGCEAVQEYNLALSNAYNTASPGFNIDAVRKNTERLRNQYPCFVQ